MLGIIILNYQTWELSLRCMQSIETNAEAGVYKIYLVDNASPKAMPEDVKQYIEMHAEEVCYIQAENNRGYAAGNNIGIKKALADGCQYLVITNNDIVFTSGVFQGFKMGFQKHPDAGIIGPKVLAEEGSIQNSRCSVKTGMKEMFCIYTLAKFFCKKAWRQYFCLKQDPDKEAYVYHVSGCCFAMTAECARQITPLDEGTMLYYEEPIIGIRMEQAGYKTVYIPECVIIHKHGGTTEGMQPFMYQCMSESELYYCGTYLHAPKWQLWLLYQYRRWLYFGRSLKNKKMREYAKVFYAKTKAKYRSITQR